jgi:predicted TIM-barrel fold metal-dependent hydrolase
MPDGCVREPTVVKSDEDVMGLAIESMRRNNIVLGIVTDSNLGDVYEWVEADPGRFWAGPAFFTPAGADTAFLRSEFEAGRLQVMGEIATQYRGFAPNDPALDPLFALAQDLDVPTLIHCEGIGGGDSRFKLSLGDPLLLQEVLDRHPDLRLWVENAGYPYLEGIIALLYRYPQVYADISTITWVIPRKEFWRYLQALMDAGLGNRLMWGSDQMNWPGTIDLAVEAIEEAPFLTEAEKADLFYNNAATFFRLGKGTEG